MRIREEILSLLGQSKPELQARFKVRSLGLFGSYARAQQQADSDVDVLVDAVSSRAIKPRALELIKQELIYAQTADWPSGRRHLGGNREGQPLHTIYDGTVL